MPELPEVNTVAAALQHFFAGETLAGWQSLTPRLRRPIPDRDQVKDLFGAELVQVVRIAKSIYFDFASELALHIHLGMTGFFSMPEKSAKPEKHEHLRLEFTSGKILAFSDPRRFGVVELAQLPLKRVLNRWPAPSTQNILQPPAGQRSHYQKPDHGPADYRWNWQYLRV